MDMYKWCTRLKLFLLLLPLLLFCCTYENALDKPDIKFINYNAHTHIRTQRDKKKERAQKCVRAWLCTWMAIKPFEEVFYKVEKAFREIKHVINDHTQTHIHRMMKEWKLFNRSSRKQHKRERRRWREIEIDALKRSKYARMSNQTTAFRAFVAHIHSNLMKLIKNLQMRLTIPWSMKFTAWFFILQKNKTHTRTDIVIIVLSKKNPFQLHEHDTSYSIRWKCISFLRNEKNLRGFSHERHKNPLKTTAKTLKIVYHWQIESKCTHVRTII